MLALPKPTGALRLFIILTFAFIKMNAWGQCDVPARSFATTQQTYTFGLASVDDEPNAVNGNMVDYSTLNVGLAGIVTQYLDFGTTQAAGTPVTIKLSFPAGLLSLLSGVTVQPYDNLHNFLGWTADAAGKAYSNPTLVGLLNGSGDMEITIVPQTAGGTPVSYTGVWINLSGLSVLQSVKVYGAFINKTGTGTVACNTAVDVLSGIRTTALGGILTATGDVLDSWKAIDNDPTYLTYAEMFVGAQVLSEVYHTTIFSSISQPGDKVRMVLQKPGGGLIDLGLLSNFSLQLYNGNTPVGSPIGASSGLLTLSVLPGTAGNEKRVVELTPPTTDLFDRVDIQIGGVATVGLVQGLRIFDVKRILPNETKINGAVATTVSLCQGSTATLTVASPQTCTTYNWYDAAVGGTLLQAGTTYTPTAASLSTSAPNIFYVEAVRNGCNDAVRTAATILVNPNPTITPGTAVPVCTGVTATTVPYTATNTPTTYSLTWDSTAATAGFNNVANAAIPATNLNITIPALATAGTYNGTITVKNANGCVSASTPISVKIDARPAQPSIALTN